VNDVEVRDVTFVGSAVDDERFHLRTVEARGMDDARIEGPLAWMKTYEADLVCSFGEGGAGVVVDGGSR
jgi:hypothetical protein